MFWIIRSALTLAMAFICFNGFAVTQEEVKVLRVHVSTKGAPNGQWVLAEQVGSRKLNLLHLNEQGRLLGFTHRRTETLVFNQYRAWKKAPSNVARFCAAYRRNHQPVLSKNP